MSRRAATSSQPATPPENRREDAFSALLDVIDECHRIHGLVLVHRLAHQGILDGREDDPEFIDLDDWAALPLGLELLNEDIDRRFRAIARANVKKGGDR